MGAEVSRLARHLLVASRYGVLSTTSVEMTGYPFGSVTTYCLDHGGQPVIQISNIAQHTINIKRDPRAALTLIESRSGDIQAQARLTYVTDVVPISDEAAVNDRFYRYFPQAKSYETMHDFSFYRLKLARGRYIGGFGEIYWLDSGDLLLANPFSADDELRIVEHMTNDHPDTLQYYFRKYKRITLASEIRPVMVGIDSEGFDVRIAKDIYRFPFAEPVHTRDEARQTLIDMAD